MDPIKLAYKQIVLESSAISHLDDYVSNSWINSVLRSNSNLKPTEHAQVNSIDSLLAPSKSRLALLRTVSIGHSTEDDLMATKVGERYTDSGYISTSKHQAGIDSVHRDMEDSGNVQGHLMHIDVPVGTPIIDINETLGKHYHQNQHEVLLPRNTSLIKTHEYVENDITHHHFKVA